MMTGEWKHILLGVLIEESNVGGEISPWGFLEGVISRLQGCTWAYQAKGGISIGAWREVHPALRRPRQKGQEFKVSSGYIIRLIWSQSIGTDNWMNELVSEGIELLSVQRTENAKIQRQENMDWKITKKRGILWPERSSQINHSWSFKAGGPELES